MFAIHINSHYTHTMFDRDEFLRARIDNYLGERHVRIKRVATSSGVLAVREASQGPITIGSFANTKREYRNNERSYFIESAPDEPGLARQLWLPAWKLVGLGTIRQREVVATTSDPSARFDAWQAVQPLVSNLEGYSEYEGEGQALFEQAKLSLQYIDANNDDFRVSISTIKF